MINGFIVLWMGEDYILSGLAPMIAVLINFLMVFRNVTDFFLIGYGLFRDIWAPIVESVIFIVVSMIAGSIWGLVGVLMGSVVSLLLIVYIWKPYYLFTQGLKVGVMKYINLFVSHMLSIFLSFFISSIVMNWLSGNWVISNGWLNWIVRGFVFFTMQSSLLLVLLFLCSSGMRSLVKRYVLKFK